MKSTVKDLVTRSAVIERLAGDPFAVAVLAGIAFWFTMGFAVGFAYNFDVREAVMYAVLAALIMGVAKGGAGGLLAREHIGNRRYREDVHNHPFLCALPTQILGVLPYSVMLHVSGVVPGAAGFAATTIAGCLFCAAVSAWGHHADSRGWDIFWQGGGLAGLIASKLDNAVHGPSPLDA